MASSTAEEQSFLDGTHPALQGNAIPSRGRRSHSPPLASSSSSRSNSASSSPAFSAVDVNPPTSAIPPLNPPTRNGGASNTGPKGVLADYHAARSMLDSPGMQVVGPRNVLPEWRDHPDFSITSPASAGTRQIISLNGNDLDDHPDEDDDDGIDDDSRAIERYRRQRIAELSGSGQRNSSQSRRYFGHLREIGVEQFLDATDNEHSDVPIVLHIYEPTIEACRQLNHHLSVLARQYPTTKFLRALASEVEFSVNTEESTLPTVLVYRGGELETTLVRIDHEWGGGSKREIERLLRSHRAIEGSPVQSLPSNGSGATRMPTLTDTDEDSE